MKTLASLSPRRLALAAALAVALGSAAEARAGGILLVRLEVLRQQECNGDELTLEVVRDRCGKALLAGKWNLCPGTRWVPINTVIPVCREAQFVLKEHDKKFLRKKTQCLGTHDIHLCSPERYKDFCQNGAYYRLVYQIVP